MNSIKITNKVLSDFKIKNNKTKIKQYIEKLRKDKDLLFSEFSEMKIFKLSELSLQQAVDLAYLLMKIEIDFQTYTENIPTVGGVIKIATIDKMGFNFISGHDIIKPVQFLCNLLGGDNMNKKGKKRSSLESISEREKEEILKEFIEDFIVKKFKQSEREKIVLLDKINIHTKGKEIIIDNQLS